jgi:fructose-1,6-bisphosphatase I
MNSDLVTLARHSIALQKENPEASGDFTLLMASIQLGCKFVASNVRKAGLANLTGLAGCKNITGDDQKKLDLIADDVFVNSLKSSGKVSVLVSEEREEAIIIEVYNLFHIGKICVLYILGRTEWELCSCF